MLALLEKRLSLKYKVAVSVVGDDNEVGNFYIDNISVNSSSSEVRGLFLSGDRNSVVNGTINDTDNTNTAALATGIHILGDDNKIIGIVVQNGSGKGLVVNGGNDNIIDDCTARDNGADTGIDNTNGDNFSDAGTGTMVGG